MLDRVLKCSIIVIDKAAIDIYWLAIIISFKLLFLPKASLNGLLKERSKHD
jgi:hypothetical protein